MFTARFGLVRTQTIPGQRVTNDQDVPEAGTGGASLGGRAGLQLARVVLLVPGSHARWVSLE